MRNPLSFGDAKNVSIVSSSIAFSKDLREMLAVHQEEDSEVDSDEVNQLRSFEDLMLFYKNSAWKYDMVSISLLSIRIVKK